MRMHMRVRVCMMIARMRALDAYREEYAHAPIHVHVYLYLHRYGTSYAHVPCAVCRVPGARPGAYLCGCRSVYMHVRACAGVCALA
jgi:hypothetical protein